MPQKGIFAGGGFQKLAIHAAPTRIIPAEHMRMPEQAKDASVPFHASHQRTQMFQSLRRRKSQIINERGVHCNHRNFHQTQRPSCFRIKTTERSACSAAESRTFRKTQSRIKRNPKRVQLPPCFGNANSQIMLPAADGRASCGGVETIEFLRKRFRSFRRGGALRKKPQMRRKAEMNSYPKISFFQ